MSRRNENREPIEVLESKKGNEYLKISGRLAEKGKSGAILNVFSGQYGLSGILTMWGNEGSSGFFPIGEDQLEIDTKNGKVVLTLEFDCGDADYGVAQDFIENPPKQERSSRRSDRDEDERPRRRSREDEDEDNERPSTRESARKKRY